MSRLDYVSGATYKFNGGEVVMYRANKTALIHREDRTYKVENAFLGSNSLMFDIKDVDGNVTSHTFMGEDNYLWRGDTASILWEAVDIHMDKLTKKVDVERAYKSLARFL